MTSKLTFDAEGEMGPALALLFYSSEYSEDELLEIVNLLKKNCKNVSGRELTGEIEFCNIINEKNRSGNLSICPAFVIRLLETEFLQGMATVEKFSYHNDVVKKISTPFLTTAKKYLPKMNNVQPSESQRMVFLDWMARVLETYMTEDQIRNQCKFYDIIQEKPEIQEERERLGIRIYSVANKGLTLAGFELIFRIFEDSFTGNDEALIQNFMKGTGNENEMKLVEEIANGYLQLFATYEPEPRWLGLYITGMLASIFAKKQFPSFKLSETFPKV